MDPRKRLENYIASAGGYATAADNLGCAEITLRFVISGRRGVGKPMAERWEKASYGYLKFSEMVRINATMPQVAMASKRKPRKPRARGRK